MLKQRREETEEQRIARIKRQNEDIRKREQKILEDKKFAEEQGAGFKVRVSNEKWSRDAGLSYPMPPKTAEIKTSTQNRLTPKRDEFKSPRLPNGSRVSRDGPPPDPRSFLADEERDYDEPSPNRFNNSEKQTTEFQGRRNDRNRGRLNGGRRLDTAERNRKDERKNIDEERIERANPGDKKSWKREWDQEKEEKEEPLVHVEVSRAAIASPGDPKKRGGLIGARGGARGCIIRRTVVNERATKKDPSPPNKMNDLDEILQRITEVCVEPTYVNTLKEEPASMSHPPPAIKSSLPATSVEYPDHQVPSASVTQHNQYTNSTNESQVPYHEHTQTKVYSTINDYLLNQQASLGIFADQQCQSTIIDQKLSMNHPTQKQLTESSPFASQQSHDHMTRNSETYNKQPQFKQVDDVTQYTSQYSNHRMANSNLYATQHVQTNHVSSNILPIQTKHPSSYPKPQHPQIVDDSYLNQHCLNEGADASLHSSQHRQYSAVGKYNCPKEEKVVPHIYSKGQVPTEHPNNQHLAYQQPTAHMYYSQQVPLEKLRAITSVPVEPTTLYSNVSHPGKSSGYRSETTSQYSAKSDIPKLPDLSVPPPSLVVSAKPQISGSQPQLPKNITTNEMDHFNLKSLKKDGVSMQHFVSPASEMYTNPTYLTPQVQAANVTPHTQSTYVDPQTKPISVPSQTQAGYKSPQNQAAYVSPQAITSCAIPLSQTPYLTTQTRAAYVTSQASYPTLQTQSAYVTSHTEPGYESPKNQVAYISPQTQAAYVTSQAQAGYESPKNQAAYISPQAQAAYISPQTQVAYESPQNQAAFESPQNEAAYVTSQTQAVYESPHNQAAYVTSQTPAAYESPQNQAAYVTPQTQSSYVAPQTQATYLNPQMQAGYVTPQTEARYVTPQTQASYITPQMQASYVTPQTLAGYVTPPTQTSHVSSQMQAAYESPRMQAAYVTSQAPEPYLTSQQTQAAYAESSIGYQDNPNLAYAPTGPYANASNVNPCKTQQDPAYYLGSQADYIAHSDLQYDYKKNSLRPDLQHQYAKVSSQHNLQYENLTQPNIQFETSSQPNIQYETSSQPNLQYETSTQPNVQYEVSSESNILCQKSQSNVQYKYENNPAGMTLSHQLYEPTCESQQESHAQIYYASEAPQHVQMSQPTPNLSVQNRLARIKQEKLSMDQSQSTPVIVTEAPTTARKGGKGKNFSFLKQAIQQNQESLKEYLADNREDAGDHPVTVVQDVQSLVTPESDQTVQPKSHSELRSRQPSNQMNVPQTKNFKQRSSFEANKPPANNKFSTNFGEYDNVDSDRVSSRRSRQSFPHNNVANTSHSRSGVASVRSHGESRLFRTIESQKKDSGHVESYLQEKLTKAKQERSSNKESKKQSLSPTDKKTEQVTIGKKSEPQKVERFDWNAECENSTELIEREAKANGKRLPDNETHSLATSGTLQDPAVSNSTNLNEKVEIFDQNKNESYKSDERPSEVEELGEVEDVGEDEEWEDLSDDEENKKNKKKSFVRFYGGYHGRY